VTVHRNYSGQTEVNRGREEGGADGESDQVYDEIVFVEVIDVQFDASGVAHDLQASPSDHTHEVTPSAMANAETDLKK
jgi:hypothetical protein